MSGLPGNRGYSILPAGVGLDEPAPEERFPTLDEMARLLWDRPDGHDAKKALALRMFAGVWASVESVPAWRASEMAEALVDEMTCTADERLKEARR